MYGSSARGVTTGRRALLSRPPGEVIAAAFGVFNPAIVVAAAQGWTSPQQQVLHPSVDEWLIANGLHLFGPSLDTIEVGAV